MVASVSSELASEMSDPSEPFCLPLPSEAGTDTGACTSGRGGEGRGGGGEGRGRAVRGWDRQ